MPDQENYVPTALARDFLDEPTLPDSERDALLCHLSGKPGSSDARTCDTLSLCGKPTGYLAPEAERNAAPRAVVVSEGSVAMARRAAELLTAEYRRG